MFRHLSAPPPGAGGRAHGRDSQRSDHDERGGDAPPLRQSHAGSRPRTRRQSPRPRQRTTATGACTKDLLRRPRCKINRTQTAPTIQRELDRIAAVLEITGVDVTGTNISVGDEMADVRWEAGDGSRRMAVISPFDPG